MWRRCWRSRMLQQLNLVVHKKSSVPHVSQALRFKYQCHVYGCRTPPHNEVQLWLSLCGDEEAVLRSTAAEDTMPYFYSMWRMSRPIISPRWCTASSKLIDKSILGIFD